MSGSRTFDFLIPRFNLVFLLVKGSIVDFLEDEERVSMVIVNNFFQSEMFSVIFFVIFFSQFLLLIQVFSIFLNQRGIELQNSTA